MYTCIKRVTCSESTSRLKIFLFESINFCTCQCFIDDRIKPLFPVMLDCFVSILKHKKLLRKTCCNLKENFTHFFLHDLFQVLIHVNNQQINTCLVYMYMVLFKWNVLELMKCSCTFRRVQRHWADIFNKFKFISSSWIFCSKMHIQTLSLHHTIICIHCSNFVYACTLNCDIHVVLSLRTTCIYQVMSHR